MPPHYYAPTGGHPGQRQSLTDRAMFTEAYAVLPRGTMRDIVVSCVPHWELTRLWVLARPLSGFAETFSQYLVEVLPNGGSDRPRSDPAAEAVLFVVDGTMDLTVDGTAHRSSRVATPTCRRGRPGPRTTPVRTRCGSTGSARRQAVEHLEGPTPFVASEQEQTPIPMPGTDERWLTTRFVEPSDLRHDMHVNVVTFLPGAVIPFAETHVMEHGLYVLEGKAVYRLNQDWVEVEAGDFMWLRAFCPQACYAGGPGPFRYLLYKDVNRHVPLVRRPL